MVQLEKSPLSYRRGEIRDPESWVSDIFKEGAIGTDLKKSLLMMFNRMKQELFIPKCLRTANITIIHKKRKHIYENTT